VQHAGTIPPAIRYEEKSHRRAGARYDTHSILGRHRPNDSVFSTCSSFWTVRATPSYFRWCLEKKLRVVQPMTLMSMSLYNEPAGTFLASILY